jgi:hypothetical protein
MEIGIITSYYIGRECVQHRGAALFLQIFRSFKTQSLPLMIYHVTGYVSPQWVHLAQWLGDQMAYVPGLGGLYARRWEFETQRPRECFI